MGLGPGPTALLVLNHTGTTRPRNLKLFSLFHPQSDHQVPCDLHHNPGPLSVSHPPPRAAILMALNEQGCKSDYRASEGGGEWRRGSEVVGLRARQCRGHGHQKKRLQETPTRAQPQCHRLRPSASIASLWMPTTGREDTPAGEEWRCGDGGVGLAVGQVAPSQALSSSQRLKHTRPKNLL